jgi:hypothetical protein
MTHTDAIRAQILELEAEVNRDPRILAIQHLKAALTALGGGLVDTVHFAAHNTKLSDRVQDKHRSPIKVGLVKKNSKINQISELVGHYIDQHGPTHRSVLVKVLDDAGLNEGLKNPLRAFGTSMHTLKASFASDGMGTFRRRESGQSDAPDHHTEFPQGDTGGVAPPAASIDEQHDRKQVGENDLEAGGT